MVKATKTILITNEEDKEEDQSSKRCVTTSRNQSSARNVSGTTDGCVLAVKAEGRRRPLLRMVMTMTIAAVDALAAGTCVATRATGPV